jgi:hypothetical protein
MRELRERGKKGKGSHCFPLVLFKDRKEIQNMGCDKGFAEPGHVRPSRSKILRKHHEGGYGETVLKL